MPANTIFIRGLRCETVLGIHDWERVKPRPILLDLDIEPSCLLAFNQDSGKGLMDYDSICTRLGALLPTLAYRTVERLAEHVAQVLLEEFHAPWVRVTLSKPGAVAGVAMVGVSIERSHTGTAQVSSPSSPSAD
jgi:FolB domain